MVPFAGRDASLQVRLGCGTGTHARVIEWTGGCNLKSGGPCSVAMRSVSPRVPRTYEVGQPTTCEGRVDICCGSTMICYGCEFGRGGAHTSSISKAGSRICSYMIQHKGIAV